MENSNITQKRGKLIHVRLSSQLHYRLKIQVAESHTNIQRWVTEAIRNALRKEWLKKYRDRKNGKPETTQNP